MRPQQLGSRAERHRADATKELWVLMGKRWFTSQKSFPHVPRDSYLSEIVYLVSSRRGASKIPPKDQTSSLFFFFTALYYHTSTILAYMV